MYEDFFADRLVALRSRKNISAREMSLAIGQNESYINRIENRKALPSMQAFFYICEYLKITPKDFFDYELVNPIKTNEIIHKLRILDDSQLDIILSVINGLEKH